MAVVTVGNSYCAMAWSTTSHVDDNLLRIQRSMGCRLSVICADRSHQDDRNNGDLWITGIYPQTTDCKWCLIGHSMAREGWRYLTEVQGSEILSQFAQSEAGGVPNLVAEEPILLDFLDAQIQILHCKQMIQCARSHLSS